MGRARDFIRRIKGKFTATPGHAVLGIDQAAVIRRSAQSIWDQALEGTKRREEADRLWKYEDREHYVCLAKRVDDPRLRRPYFAVATVSEIPGCGVFAIGKGWTVDDAECQLRFRLAQIYTERGVVRDFDEARERASKVELIIERSFAHGTAGILT